MTMRLSHFKCGRFFFFSLYFYSANLTIFISFTVCSTCYGNDDGDNEGWDQGDEGKGSRRVLTLRCVVFYCFLEYSTDFFFTVYSTYDDEDVDSDDEGWDQRDKGACVLTLRYVIFYCFLDY